MVTIEYKYDVFLSWTGKDRAIKNRVRAILEENNLACYDSDRDCKGDFVSDFCDALRHSKVYLMILTDNVFNDPNLSGKGSFSEVKTEVSLAKQMEALGYLNFIILNFSEKITTRNIFFNSDVLQFYYDRTRGYSFINAQLPDETQEEVILEEQTEQAIVSKAVQFAEARNAGKPLPPIKPEYGVIKEDCTLFYNVCGREEEIKKIKDAYNNGAQIVVLCGIGGIGKTTIAKAAIASGDLKLQFLQTAVIDDDPNNPNRNIIGDIIAAIKFDDESLNKLDSNAKMAKKIELLKKLPEYAVILLDNFNDITMDALYALLKEFKCRFLITTRNLTDKKGLPISNKIVTINITLPGKEAPDIIGLNIPTLSFEEAVKFMRQESERQLSEEDVKLWYDLANGHTLTLMLIARTLASNNLTTEQLFGKIGGGAELMTSYTDNQNTLHTNSIENIMCELFRVSEIEKSDIRRRILCNLALVSDGIPEEKLKELDENGNEINRLVKAGWAEYSGDIGSRKVYLHGMLANFVVKPKLKPTSESAKLAIDYLCELADNYKGLTYGNAKSMVTQIYGALLLLAKNEGKLNEQLWERYRILSVDCLVYADITKQCEKLEKYVNDSGIKSFALVAYANEHPGDYAEIDTLITEILQKDNYNYKEVLYILSVYGEYLSTDDKARGMIAEKLLEIADVIIKRQDGMSLLVLYVQCLLYGNDKPIRKKIKAYLKKKLKEGRITGYELYLQFMLPFNGNDLKNGSRIFNDSIQAISSDNKGGQIKILFKYLKKVVNGYRTMNFLTNHNNMIEEDCAFEAIGAIFINLINFYSSSVFKISNIDAENDLADINEILVAAYGMYKDLNDAGLTGISANKAMEQLMGMLSMIMNKSGAVLQLPSITYKGRGEEYTIEEINNLKFQTMINLELQSGAESEFRQKANALIEIAKNACPEEAGADGRPVKNIYNIKMAEAYYNAARLMQKNGYLTGASECYFNAIVILCKIAPKSNLFYNSCIGFFLCSNQVYQDKARNLYKCTYNKRIDKVYALAKEHMQEYSSKLLSIICEYVKCKSVSWSRDISTEECFAHMQEALDILKKAVKDIKLYNFADADKTLCNAISECLYRMLQEVLITDFDNLSEAGKILECDKVKEIRRELLELIYILAKQAKRKNRAYLHSLYSENDARIEMSEILSGDKKASEGTYELLRNTVKEKCKIFSYNSALHFLGHLFDFAGNSDDVKQFCSYFFKKGKYFEKASQTVEEGMVILIDLHKGNLNDLTEKDLFLEYSSFVCARASAKAKKIGNQIKKEVLAEANIRGYNANKFMLAVLQKCTAYIKKLYG